MKYLFFDIECASCEDGGKICEFGYVLTDESFNELESEEFIINPRASFDTVVLKNILRYSTQVYRASQDYSFYYDKISRLFEMQDLIVVGHTVDADAKFLNDEAKRYNKPFFNYKFYDAKYMYSSFAKTQSLMGLEKISENFGYDKKHLQHRAVDDAATTKFIVQTMCEKSDCDLLTLIKNSKFCFGETVDGVVISSPDREIAKARREELRKNITNPQNAVLNANYDRFRQFIEDVKPEGEIIESELNGKSLTVTLNYQIGHYREMLSLVQLLKNHGCTYQVNAVKSDYMVTRAVYNEDGSERYCSKTENLKGAIKHGANIKFITFEELLDILNVQEKDLYKMSYKLPKIFPQKSYSSTHGKKRFSGKPKRKKQVGAEFRKEGKEKYGPEKFEKKYNTKERVSVV